MEIIVIDDGSTDSTGVIADLLANEHENVKVLHQMNTGAAGARNAGLRIAKGEYIGFVDSDDFIAPTMYEELARSMERAGVSIAGCARRELSEDGKRLPDVVKYFDRPKIATAEAYLRSLLLYKGDASFCTKLIRHELFQEVGLFPAGETNEDFYLLLRLLRKTDRVLLLPDRRYYVVYRQGSVTRGNKANKDAFSPVYADAIRNAEYAARIVRREFPALELEAEHFLMKQRLEYLLHIPVAQMTPENTFYQMQARYLKTHLPQALQNPFLSSKDKRNLVLLAPNPRAVRAAHAKMKAR